MAAQYSAHAHEPNPSRMVDFMGLFHNKWYRKK